MELSIDVLPEGYCKDCKITVRDTSTYLDEGDGTVAKDKFKFSQTVSVFLLQHNKTGGRENGSPVVVKDGREAVIPVGFDGWFTVMEIVLPTREWAYSGSDAVKLYGTVYFSDGQSFYKRREGYDEEVALEEIVEVNTAGTTLSRVAKDYVSICYLKKCYINLCRQIFNDRAFSSCMQKNGVDSELIFKRDMTWMAINVIKYLTECEQLAEVERIIETVVKCNGLCPPANERRQDGCGCSQA